MDNFLLVYVIPILGAVIALLAWHYGTIKKKWGQRGKGKETEEKEEKEVAVRVYDCDHRTIFNQSISMEKAKEIKKDYGSLGRQINRYGVETYALQLKNGEYSPAPISASSVSINPRSIGEDLAIGYSIYLFYRPELGKEGSNNLKQILWWSGIVAFIIFMIVTQ